MQLLLFLLQSFTPSFVFPQAAIDDKEAAINESARCARKLELANRLITALASEGERWAMTVQQLGKDYEVGSLFTGGQVCHM